MILIVASKFAIDFVTRSSIANAIRATSLNHEIRNHSMENQSIIKIMLSQVNKILYGVRSICFKELDLHDSLFCVDFCYLHCIRIVFNVECKITAKIRK